MTKANARRMKVPAPGPDANVAVGAPSADRPRWRHLLIVVFVCSLLFPTSTSFYVGSLRISPYRLVLLVAALPCSYLLLSGAVGRLRAPDFLMFLFGLWAIVALGVHHGMNVAAESGGIYLIETFGAYCLGRILIRNASDFVFFARVLLGVVLVLMPFLVIESITGQHFIQQLFASATGGSFSSSMGERFGFTRAFGPFDHPILGGVFCASAIGLSWYALPTTNWMRGTRTLGVIIAAMASVSSGAMAAINTQAICIGWDRLTRSHRHRWKVLVGLMVCSYVFIGVLSNRTAMKVLLSYLTFSSDTAYNRIMIWELGSAEVARHPLFGIGNNDWARPEWMFSSSMDAFWLVVAVTYGLPAFLLLAGAVLYTMFASRRAAATNPSLQKGWVVSMVGLIVAACTVHFWNQSLVYFCFLLGAGVWMCNKREMTRGA